MLIQLTGFDDFRMIFHQLQVSQSINFPGADGWLTFPLNPQPATTTYQFYFQLKTAGEAGDLIIGIENGNSVVGKGTGEKYTFSSLTLVQFIFKLVISHVFEFNSQTFFYFSDLISPQNHAHSILPKC